MDFESKRHNDYIVLCVKISVIPAKLFVYERNQQIAH